MRPIADILYTVLNRARRLIEDMRELLSREVVEVAHSSFCEAAQAANVTALDRACDED